MPNQSLSLFNLEDDSQTRTLFTIKDNEVADLAISEIFDAEKYTHFRAVTFSVSPEFVNKELAEFDQLEIILGIQEGKQQHSLNETLLGLNTARHIADLLRYEPQIMYNKLADPLKYSLADESFQMLVPVSSSIHTKFYLLENHSTSANRLIVGSANLSYQAFSTNFHQFESILIFDNHPLFHLFETEYEQILKPACQTYFPESLFVINEKKLERKEKDEKAPLVLTNTEIETVAVDGAYEAMEAVNQERILGRISNQEFYNLRDLGSQMAVENERTREDLVIDEKTFEFVRDSINPKAIVNPKLNPKPQIKAKAREKIQVLSVSNTLEGIGKLESRPVLYNEPNQRNLMKDYSGLFTENIVTKNPEMIGELLSEAEIKEELATLDMLVHSYMKFAYKADLAYGKQIMEAVLYVYTSAFLSEIRKKTRDSEEALDVPVYLLLGGVGGSGKTTLLKMLRRLVGLNSNEEAPLWTLDDVMHQYSSRHKANSKNEIMAAMGSNNVYPIFLDELTTWAFESNYADDWIKNGTNRLATIDYQTPAFIGTTNVADYSLDRASSRRVYYLAFDRIFANTDVEEKAERDAYKADLENKLSSRLFLDFAIRMARRLEDVADQDFFSYSENAKKIDFLTQTRQIFAEYYQLIDEELPVYFPDDLYDMSDHQNREKWRAAFLGSEDEFIYYPQENTYVIDITYFDRYQTTRYGGDSSIGYRNALDSRVLKSSSTGNFITLDADAFLAWIDLEKSSLKEFSEEVEIKNESLWNKITAIFKK